VSKLSDAFRAAGVINTHDLLSRFAKGESLKSISIAIDYRPGFEGRGGTVPKTVVWSPFFKTDQNAHWQDQHAKTFVGKRVISHPLALAWACALTGTSADEWASDPTSTGRGCLVHRKVRDAALAWLKAQST
jgi:hypothetical protein